MSAARDPLGVYMIGFTLRRTPAEAREAAETQLALAQQVGDGDGVAHWRRVLAFLAATR